MAFLIILMAVGVLFILSEILIVPGTVVSGVLGIAALGASCIYAYIEFGAVTGTAVTVSGVLLAVLMTVSMIRAGLRKRLGSDVPKSGFLDGSGIMPGDTGRSVSRIAPCGMASIGGEDVEVISLEGGIEAGTDVSVVLIEDGKIYVKPAEEDF